MFKFIKHEIRLNSRTMLGILIFLIFSLVLLSGAISNLSKAENSVSVGVVTLLGVSILIMFGAFLTGFIKIISSFIDEFDNDKGYLTFSLPLTSKEIVLAKLATGIIWYFTVGLIVVLFLFFMGLIYGDGVFNFDYKAMGEFLLSFVTGLIYNLMTIFFAITLTKTIFKHKKVGGMWIVVYIGISVIVGLLSTLLAFSLESMGLKEAVFDTALSINPVDGGLTSSFNQEGFNIFTIILNAVLSVAMFFMTSYLIDKKIEI